MDLQKIKELPNNTSPSFDDNLIAESSVDGSVYKIKLDVIKDGISPLIPGDGLKGSKGLKGETGNLGATGSKGDKGDEGDRGNQGAKGQKGYKGNAGQQGDVGDLGLPAETGEKGDTGPKGFKGNMGQRGIRGSDGEDADDGEKGYRGIQGNTGAPGDIGEKGEIGGSYQIGHSILKSKQGTKGERGDTSVSAINGDMGFVGVPGDKGKKGRAGPRGLPGVRENKVNYPLYGAKFSRNWISIYTDGIENNSNGLDYITKSYYLEDDFTQLKYKFVKLIFSVDSNYIPENVVQSGCLLTCTLMIPGKITNWSPVLHGSPPILWYKESSDTQNIKTSRNNQRQGVQIYLDVENDTPTESEWPNQKIRLVANKPNSSFNLNVSDDVVQFKILGVYGTNDI